MKPIKDTRTEYEKLKEQVIKQLGYEEMERILKLAQEVK
jgi:hypothetical protein